MVGLMFAFCPSKVLAASLAVSRTSPSRRPPLVDPRALQSVIETKYRAVWVTRSRPGVTVTGSPARSSVVSVAGHLRVRLHPLVRFANPAESLELRAARRYCPSCLPWAFVPHRGVIGWSPPGTSLPGPHRSVLDVSHVLDGLLLHPTSRVCFTPQPRPGFTLQGFPPARSRASSSPAAALVSFAPAVKLPV